MPPAKLSLIAVDPALISNFEALNANAVRYVGRRLDRDAKAFVATGKPELLTPCAEYVQAVQRGELLPGDEPTANYCGVRWQPVSK